MNWIKKNRKWIFSGVGATLLALVFQIFFFQKEPESNEPIGIQINDNSNISGGNFAGRDININKKDQSELIKTLEFRAEKLNEHLEKYYYYNEVVNYLEKFNTLHKKHIEALKNNDFILAHEILSQIHQLSFELDSKEEQSQQINLYGDIRYQYFTSFGQKNIFGGIAAFYFQKQIQPYDSTSYAGNVVYHNKIEYKWPKHPFSSDSIKVFYKKNFLTE
ncbi:hypothetical protein [Flagellimonas sp.]|jgi:hypothetical protein|uniref:hypothetical protein n=1 Tax=Flagellimonas sp. TaxID=2058762 RepID=UPI003BAB9B1A